MDSRPTPFISPRPSPARTLLGWRTQFGFGWLEGALLALYVSVLAIVIPRHEPWADEAQAWLIARDNSLWQIFRYRLHYEGWPGLWHLVLHVFHQLGGSYAAINWLGAAFATAGIVVFLRWSPFPLLVRALVPFTFFLQYQYAVISRGYTLFAVLVFALCVLFYRRTNPVWFFLIAGLLANISLQGTVYSFLLTGLYLYHRFRWQARANSAALPKAAGLLRPAVLYLAFVAVAGLTAVPAPDCGISDGPPVFGGPVQKLLTFFPGPLPESERPPGRPMDFRSRSRLVSYPSPAPYELWPWRPFRQHPGAWAAWWIYHLEYDAHQHVAPPHLSQELLHTSIEMLSLATAPVSNYRSLACVFLLVLGVWLWSRRALRHLLPWAGNIVVGEALWIADHHTGMLFLSLLTAMWLAAPGVAPGPAMGRLRSAYDRTLDRALLLLFGVVCSVQIAWTFASVRQDLRKSYGPGPQTAAFLQQAPRGRMAAFGFISVDVQPYFAHNPFFNLRRSYWIWSLENPNSKFLPTIAQHPDLVLFSQDLLLPDFMHNDWAPLSPLTSNTQERDLAHNPIVQDLWMNGYRETHRFCGDRFMRFGASYRSCNLIFSPSAQRK